MPIKVNKSQIILALFTIKNNPTLSIQGATRIYLVDFSTLAYQQCGRTSRRDTIPNSRKLTNLEKGTIVEYILDLDSRSFPPRLSSMQDIANRLLANRDASPVGSQ